jgi:hypothetical protein
MSLLIGIELAILAVAAIMGLYQAVLPDSFLRWRNRRLATDVEKNRNVRLELGQAAAQLLLKTPEAEAGYVQRRRRIRWIGIAVVFTSVVSGVATYTLLWWSAR